MKSLVMFIRSAASAAARGLSLLEEGEGGSVALSGLFFGVFLFLPLLLMVQS